MKKNNFFNYCILFFSLVNLPAIEPDVFVQSTVNRASKILSEELSKEKKMEELKKIALETVDIKGIGFYTLGPARKNLNDSQKEEYSKLFKDYFLKTFSSRLAEYTNPEIDVLNKETLNKNYTIVNSILRTAERANQNSWKFILKKREPTYKRLNYWRAELSQNSERGICVNIKL